MKKLLAIILSVLLLSGVVTAQAAPACYGQQRLCFADSNGDGICDNQGSCGMSDSGFADADKDGICDNCAERFLDRNNDGICERQPLRRSYQGHSRRCGKN